MESDTAQYPVNHRIVAGEPVVSKNYSTRRIKWGDIKVNNHRFTGFEGYWNRSGLSDNSTRSAIQKAETDRRDGSQRKFLSVSKIRVYETMGRPRVDKSDDQGSESGSEWNTKGVRVGKSGSVKADFLHKCTARINAVLRVCGGMRAA